MGVVAVRVVACAVADRFARIGVDGASAILVCFASSGGVALNSSLADARGFAKIASGIDVGGGCASLGDLSGGSIAGMWDVGGALGVMVVRGNGGARCLSNVGGTRLRHVGVVTVLWHVGVLQCSRLWAV
uniref:Uncharacterized protein n=1 Tax=Chromera velia CCMP2878 TaxID=1169474 RepID=A0A0G4FCA1_9ALVE|eukprot:Cvel_3189.t1-p1 / transcript=Cvel_3189.t1 / gene=Cvel_3189 / organism=Chromera_velia_CCMP2878 / gene_product=hypothetical protein / transcript_product=hypothetical protein / location=Cvel_scaffold124:67768-68154(-) / protein_length=129 / sequence_SO=supercontig / SO=protein_coding / is_pseudo=false